MSTTAIVTDVQKNFGAYHDLALVAPVRVTKDGRETVYIVSANTFHSLKQAHHEAIAAADLSDDELPAEHRYHLDPQTES